MKKLLGFLFRFLVSCVFVWVWYTAFIIFLKFLLASPYHVYLKDPSLWFVLLLAAFLQFESKD